MDEIYQYLRCHVEVINSFTGEDLLIVSRMVVVIVSAVENGGNC